MLLMRNKIFYNLVVCPIKFGLLLLLFNVLLPQDIRSQRTNCTFCSEEYFSCGRNDIGPCVEKKLQRCRAEGMDESTCENGRPQFEAECQTEIQEDCEQKYNYCWALCNPSATVPPPPGIMPNGSTCNLASGSIGAVDEKGRVPASVSDFPATGYFGIEFYIDGNSVEVVNTGSSNYVTWSIPSEYRDGEEHTLSAFTSDLCVNGVIRTCHTIQLDGPSTFVLSPRIRFSNLQSLYFLDLKQIPEVGKFNF